jgi:hypothetical protein
MKTTFWTKLATVTGRMSMRLPFPLWIPFEKIYEIAYNRLGWSAWYQDGQWWEIED